VRVKIVLGADHAGFDLKQALSGQLRQAGHVVEDVGADTLRPDDDYVDYALGVARAVAERRVERGVLLCGSGVGATVAANRIAGVRACVCHDTYSAHQGVEHDDMNVLVLGARVIGLQLACELVNAFLAASFTAEPRHVRRLEKIRQLESASTP
jgi:RpiB/LacA/LacB family sugar-phosphate isomerase